MTLEVEVKGYVNDFGEIKKNLMAMGAQFLGEVKHKDIYYNPPHKNFYHTQEAFRMRIIDDGKKYYFTYKGPKIDDISKSREEIEILIDKGKEGMNLLKKFDFAKIATIEKSRKKYQYEIFEISLDDVKGLGKFVEVEVKTEEKNYEKYRDQVLKTLKKLGIEKMERKSYLELYLRKSIFSE